MANPPRLLVIDSNSLIHRAWHALPPLSTSQGELVNALYGFLAIFLKAVKEFQPEYVAAAFDAPGPTKREEAYKEYKATRAEAPDELYAQIPLVKRALEVLGVSYFEKEGYEADDIIGTIASRAPQNVETIILSGDLDTLQLVDEHTNVYYAKGVQSSQLYDREGVGRRLAGLSPEQIPDYKGLAGDSSDNIPGVRGVGGKTATQLLGAFGTLEKLYEAAEAGRADIAPATAKKLVQDREKAFLSRELAVIDRSVPISFALKDLTWNDFDREAALQMLREYEFRSLEDRLRELGGREASSGMSREERIEEKIERLFQEGILPERLKELELRLTPVLRTMEDTGILIDKKYFAKLRSQLQKHLKALEKSIYKKTGGEFNINSPQQLSEALFSRLGLSPKGLKKTPGGVVSTASPELEKLQGAHPVVQDVLRYRELAKLSTTYLTPLPELADKQGRVHTHFDQLGTATGRLSSANPNLQNIPVLGEWGRKVRKGFVAEQGWVFLACDYSQVELRIAAHLAEEETLQEAFARGEDIHTRTAAEVFGVPARDVTKEQRRNAKALNFGVLYGMGARGFAAAAHIPTEEAELFIEHYFQRFPNIRLYVEGTKEFARAHGYVETLWGRKRYLPDINSRTPYLRAAAERMAVNMPIQGTSADFIKQAMVDIHEKYGKEKDMRVLLQIHDELLFEVRRGREDEYGASLQELMERVEELRAPLRVERKTGKSWGELL